MKNLTKSVIAATVLTISGGVYARAGVGSYNGYSAVSVGLTAVKGTTSVSANVSTGTGGTPVFGVGVSHKLF